MRRRAWLRIVSRRQVGIGRGALSAPALRYSAVVEQLGRIIVMISDQFGMTRRPELSTVSSPQTVWPAASPPPGASRDTTGVRPALAFGRLSTRYSIGR